MAGLREIRMIGMTTTERFPLIRFQTRRKIVLHQSRNKREREPHLSANPKVHMEFGCYRFQDHERTLLMWMHTGRSMMGLIWWKWST